MTLHTRQVARRWAKEIWDLNNPEVFPRGVQWEGTLYDDGSKPPTFPAPVPDPPSDIDPEKTKADGDKALAEHIATERKNLTAPTP